MFNKIVKELYVDIVSLPTREETLSKCINKKLNFSEDMYISQIKEASDYLLSRDNLKVLKTIARENKKEEKQKELDF